MKKQNNHISDERLSSYFDDEISASDKDLIEKHLTECEYCQNRLARFKQLQEISQQSPDPILEKENLWASIDNQIGSLSNPPISSTGYKRWIAAAAIILIALTGGWLLLGDQFSAMEKESLAATFVNQYAFDYGLYLSGLDNPQLMKQFNDGYKRQKVELAGLAKSPITQVDTSLLNNLPQGFSLESAHLLKSACCQCKQYTLEYHGQKVTIFQQPKKHPAEFTGFHKKHTKIDSADCSKVETRKHLALTFNSNDSKYVVVGEQQDPMISQIISRLANDN